MTKVCPTCNTTYPDSKAFCPDDGTTLRAAEVHGSLIGNVVADRYLVTDLLGEGGMGKVYLARHVRLPRMAAIKILHRNMVSDPDAVVRFNREAANASRIVHERVATVWDFGETHDGLVYLAMEYVPGRTLKQLLAEDGALSPERTAPLIGQIADGLDAAHRLKIVHRDLKPDNILVWQNEAGEDECKIVDFGIAKAAGVDGDEHALTKTGFVVGTPEYMSPEQIRGDTVDVRSDVYALGLVAYRCLTGEAAFDTNTPDRGMMARLNGAPRTLDELLPGARFSPDVQRVLLQALAIDPSARFASAGVFATALARALHAQTATSAPTRTVATPRDEPVRASAPVVAPPITAPRTAPKPKPEPTPRAKPTPTPAKSRTPTQGAAGSRERSKPAPAPAPRPAAAPVAAAPALPPAFAPPLMATPQAAVPAAHVTRAPSRRRLLRLPRIPVVRWVSTVAVLGFGWLVLTEGSLNRAIRRATGLAREAETTGKRLVDQAVDQAAATVRSASGGGAGRATAALSAAASGAGSGTLAEPAAEPPLPESANAVIDSATTTRAATDAPAGATTSAPSGETSQATTGSTVAPAEPAGVTSPAAPAVTVGATVQARIAASGRALAAGDSSAACSALVEARQAARTAADSAAVRLASVRSGCG